MDYPDRSITELEVRHAILNDGMSATSQRAKIYLKDIHGLPPSAGHEKLARLKDELTACGVTSRRYGSDMNDFAEQVLADLRNQIELDFPLSYVGLCPLPLCKCRIDVRCPVERRRQKWNWRD